MKKYISIIFLLNFIVAASQETIVPLEEQYRSEGPYTNVYFKDVSGYLDPFVGTWEYSGATVYFKVNFYKLTHARGGFGLYTTIFEDELRSFILYKVLENGTWVTKYNTFTIIFIGDEEANSSSIRGNLLGVTQNEINLRYTEPTTHCRRLKTAALELELFEENGIEKLKWGRRRPKNNRLGTGFCPDGSPLDESNFIIPKDMVLTKVN